MIRILIICMVLANSLQDTIPERITRDTVPRPIPDLLDPSLFIPKDRLFGYQPWTYAPIERPIFPVLKIYGYDGTIGFGSYSLQHPERFFSTLEGHNVITVPQYYISRQMMLGNTLRLSRNFYFMSGILYGSQMGTLGNNWGMGTREGLIWFPHPMVSIALWTQYFQSVLVYSPVIFPRPDKPDDGSAILMPATPEVFSVGVQASFVVGEFIIDIGTSVAPVPFQYRHHSKFRYR